MRKNGTFEGVQRKCRIDVKFYKRRTSFPLRFLFVKKKKNNDRISIHESLECKCLITYNADDGVSRATRLLAPLERALTTGWDNGLSSIFRMSRDRNL